MNLSKNEPFSWTWVFISLAMFIGMEIVLGILLGHFVVGRYASLSLRFLLQGILNLASYFVGGFLIGVITPRVRILEPGIGAFIAVAATICLTLFTPYSFIRFSLTKIIVGGVIAFVLALSGAKLGERLTGQLREP